MHLSDRITGAAIAALGAAAAYGGSLLPPVPGQQVGPNVFPLVIGIGLVLCGALIAFGIGQSFEEPVVIEGDTIERPQHAWWRGFRVLVPPALLLLYVFASEPLGFIPVAALIALITCLTLGGSWRLAIPVAIVAPVFVHIVFAKLLRVPLPPGLLPMPW